MGLKIVNNGNGEIGPTTPGWSEQEFATPVSPAETAGGTGTVSYSAGKREESLLLINNSVIAEHEDEINSLGSVTGVVRSVSESGLNVSLTQDNKLARFDTDRTMPPLGAGSVPVALRLANQIISDESGFNGTSGYFWSLDGHQLGFDFQGNRIVADATTQTYSYYDVSTATFLQSDPITTYQGVLDANGYQVLDDRLYASGVVGDSFVLESAQGFFNSFMASNTKMMLMGKVMLDGQDCVVTLVGQPQGPADGDYYQNVVATVDYSAETVTISVDCRSGGLPTNFSDTQSIAGLDLDSEIAFRFYWTYAALFAAMPPVLYSTSFSVCNTSDYSTIVEATLPNYSADLRPLWFDRWTVDGNVRALWYRFGLETTSNPVSWPVGEQQDWEVASTTPIIVTGSEVIGPPALGFTGNVWQYLQNACTACGWQIGLTNDEITCQPYGTTTLDIFNYSPTPTLTPTTTFTGRQVDIVYTNAELIQTGELYDAGSDDNRIISVGAAETVTITVGQENVFPTLLLPPIRTTTFIPGEGTYFVVDSTGLPIVEGQWEDWGGSVSASLNPDVAGGIQVTVIGPREQIPSTTAPYSLAVSDGQNQYGALSILGSGVIATPETLNLLTGADEDKTPQQIATTITNPFINTVEQAYDAGLWAALDAAGPKVALSITIPISGLEGFGETAGSLIDWRDSTYRVNSATVGSIGASLDCVRHVTVGAFDAVWVAKTVGQHDTVWAGYVCEDQTIFPYKSA